MCAIGGPESRNTGRLTVGSLILKFPTASHPSTISDYQNTRMSALECLTTSKRPEFHTPNVGAINCIAIDSLDQSQFLLAGGADSSLTIYDLASYTTIDLNKGREEVTLGPDYVKGFECITRVPRGHAHRFGLSCVQWWPFDNGMFVSGSFDGAIKAWDTNTAADGEVYTFHLGDDSEDSTGGGHRVYSFDISATGQHSLIAPATTHPSIRLLDLRTTASTHTLRGHKRGSILSVQWSPTQPHLLASGAADGSVRLWDIRRADACLTALDLDQASPFGAEDATTPKYLTKTPVDSRRAHRNAVNALKWLPDGHSILTAGCDESVRLWRDLDTTPTAENARNSLVNYGPLIRNKYPQSLYMCLATDLPPMPSSEGGTEETSETRYSLFFPSDSGQILVFDVFSGALVAELERPLPPTSKKDRPKRSLNFSGQLARTTCVTPRGGDTFEFYSGALDGTITRWHMPNQDVATSEANNHGDDGKNSSDSDSSDYEEYANDFTL